MTETYPNYILLDKKTRMIDCLTNAQIHIHPRNPSRDEMQELFKPLQSTRAFEEVSNRVKQLIFKGVLKPGEKLPSEGQLAAQFGVGRQTIREALRVLELSGFIDVQRGGAGGPTIKNTILATVSKALADAIQMESITVDELTLARVEIERCVLTQVIRNADAEDMAALKDNVARAKRKIAAGTQAFGENIEFHRLLARCSKNQVFAIVVESIMAVVTDFLSRLKPNIKNSNLVVRSHEQIVEAIIRKDGEQALALLEEHLLTVKERLQKSYDQQKRGRKPRRQPSEASESGNIRTSS